MIIIINVIFQTNHFYLTTRITMIQAPFQLYSGLQRLQKFDLEFGHHFPKCIH